MGTEVGRPNITGVPEAHAEALKATAGFGTTLVTEASNLARYVGRILGTAPEDAVGLVIGDPLRFVRTAIATRYDGLLSETLRRRNVIQTEPISPSVALPLLQAAYDEGRPELQALWVSLIASAMDPSRAGLVRLSYIETLKRFDPLDAMILKERAERTGEMEPNPASFMARLLQVELDDVTISLDNLASLQCIQMEKRQFYFSMTAYGRGLVRACAE
ncbi:Abi-alpha family protein [Bosea sp. (in: a-proteobacteria)]|uniref:Abi-alpha family protein n=1 Tax=Bosea sp. (in: a-proteobacteria) TaxID=1871050 RepID=UPI003B3ACC1F